METQWNYTELAKAYVNRPNYAKAAIDRIVETAGVSKGAYVCDVGAGVAHLTIPLLERGLIVDALEPNDAMRALGRQRTSGFDGIRWFAAVGEETGMADHSYQLVTFGSSFNVTDRPAALRETARIAKPRGWFTCLWNHRDLDDPLQAKVEDIIRAHIPGYDYGSRREDQTDTIRASGLFDEPISFEAPTIHRLPAAIWLDAWRSHATLARQAGETFPAIIEAIDAFLKQGGQTEIDVPYTTRVWVARLKG